MILELIKNFDGISIIDENGSFSYNQLSNQVNKYKNQLDKKIIDFDNVIIYSDYNFYSISLLIYLSKRTVNIIPIIKTTQKEFESKIQELSNSKIIFLDSKGTINITENNDKKNLIKRNLILENSETGLVLFSSGTTGKPKVMIQNFSKIIKEIVIPKRQKKLNFLIFLMFDHIGGINTLLNCLINGSTIVIPKDRNPSTIISVIEKHNINVFPTSPTFLNLMLMDDSFSQNKMNSLRLITYGTERMPSELLKRLNKILPKVKLLQTFGTSETGILKTISKSSDSTFFKIVDTNKDYKIVDGELFLRSITAVKGYLNHDNSNFKSDGWYASGDLVKEDSEGYIKIIGRKNKIINVGGLKVLPSEVEDVINNVEGVIDSFVYGEDSIITGNIVCVKVATKLPYQITLKKNIKKECKLKLDKYKIPVKIIFNDLKMNKRGKKDA